MFSHIMVGTNDFDRAKAFYDTVLATLGVKPGMVNVAATGHKRAFWMHAGGMFGISEPINNEPATASNRSRRSMMPRSLRVAPRSKTRRGRARARWARSTLAMSAISTGTSCACCTARDLSSGSLT